MASERQRVRGGTAALAICLACSASAYAEDPAAAPEVKRIEPKPVRQIGGERGAKIEAKRAGENAAKGEPGMQERMEKFRAMREAARGAHGPGHHEGDVSRAAESAADGDDKTDELSMAEREQRRLERGKRARHMHWRAMMRHVRRPSDIPPDVRAELRHHARRLAWLKRIEVLAREKNDTKTADRAAKLIVREHERHGHAMEQQLGALDPAKAAATAAADKQAAPAAEAKAADEPGPEGEAEEEDQGGEP